jgi:hypothetical protein
MNVSLYCIYNLFRRTILAVWLIVLVRNFFLCASFILHTILLPVTTACPQSRLFSSYMPLEEYRASASRLKASKSVVKAFDLAFKRFDDRRFSVIAGGCYAHGLATCECSLDLLITSDTPFTFADCVRMCNALPLVTHVGHEEVTILGLEVHSFYVHATVRISTPVPQTFSVNFLESYDSESQSSRDSYILDKLSSGAGDFLLAVKIWARSRRISRVEYGGFTTYCILILAAMVYDTHGPDFNALLNAITTLRDKRTKCLSVCGKNFIPRMRQHRKDFVDVRCPCASHKNFGVNAACSVHEMWWGHITTEVDRAREILEEINASTDGIRRPQLDTVLDALL